MKYKSLRITILLLFVGTALPAQIPVSLAEAVARGLQNNYQIKISYNSQAIATANNTWGNAGALPILGLSSNPSFSFRRQGAQLGFAGEIIDTTNTSTTVDAAVALGLNWVLFDGFRMQINKTRFGLLEELSVGNTRFLVENSLQSIINAYNRVLLEKSKLSVFEKTTQLSKDRYNYQQQKQELGTSSSYEVLQTKINYLTDKSNQLTQKQLYENSLRDLSFVIGEKDSVFVPTDSLVAPKQQYDLAALSAKMTANNTNLRNQMLNIRVREQDEKLAQSVYYPQLSFTGQTSYGYNQTTFNGIDFPGATTLFHRVGLSLNFNIFNGFNDERRVAISKINTEIEHIKLQEVEHQLNNQLLRSYDQFALRQELLALAISRHEATELNLELSRERYNRGAINSFNYRSVQLDFLNASIAQYQAVFNLLSSQVEIARLTGSIIRQE